MAEAVAADEVDHQEHQKGAAYHHNYGDLQAEDQIGEIIEAPDYVRPENSTEQLRGEHVHAYGRGVGAARHHVVDYGGKRPVIPGHEEAGNEEGADDDVL